MSENLEGKIGEVTAEIGLMLVTNLIDQPGSQQPEVKKTAISGSAGEPSEGISGFNWSFKVCVFFSFVLSRRALEMA